MPYKLEDIQKKIKMKDSTQMIESEMNNIKKEEFVETEAIVEKPKKKKIIRVREEKKKDSFDVYIYRTFKIVCLILFTVLFSSLLIKLISIMFS